MKSKSTISPFILFLLPAFLTLPAKRAYPSHAAGGEISYVHLSGSAYIIKTVIYRDCLGIPAPASATISIQSASCGVNFTHILPVVSVSFTSLICPFDSSMCLGGNAPDYAKHEYADTINLPGQCSDWIFSFTECCRNAAITTLQSPGSEDLYLEAHLNNLTGDNSSAQFINNPIFFNCITQDLHYNNGMFDPDVDSLVYALACPKSGPNDCVVYLPGYHQLQPFSSVLPITFDGFTGDFFMHPAAIEVGVLAYRIFEYRNGNLIGSVTRDVSMMTVLCPGHKPTATHMNGTSQQIAYVFPTDTICFNIFSHDSDGVDTLTMTWNQTIPAATFTTNGALIPTGTFCWTPTINDVRSQPYMFTVRIQDNACPINNANVYSYYIYVTLDSSLVFASIPRAEDHNRNRVIIFPNPSEGVLHFQTEEVISVVRIMNLSGKILIDVPFRKSYDVSFLPSGTYFLEAVLPDGHSLYSVLTIN